MVVVFAFDKFRPYIILSKIIVYPDHSALGNLFKKQDAKPRLIRWILLLQDFDIEIKDKKGTKNVAADHLSQIENDVTSDNDEIDDNFPGETLMEISTRDIPWFADFANYLVGDIMPKEMRDYSRPSHEAYQNTIEFPDGNNVVPLRSDTIRQTINQSASGKLHDRNAKESWALLEDLSLYDKRSWNDLRDFAKLVKAISLPQDVLSTSDRHLSELENQVQHLMEAHLAPKSSIQMNKIASSCGIYSGPHDTQYCLENHEQAFVDCVS
nr:reverse transcriptase domain-containing protein [Tanacetum cinerariifolium]